MEVEVELLHFNECLKRRSDIDHPKWFSFDHNMLGHSDFFEISGDEFKSYVHLLCVASKLSKNIVKYHIGQASRDCNLSGDVIMSMITKLEGKRLFRILDGGRRADGTRPRHGRGTASRQEKKREEKKRGKPEPSFEFEPIWLMIKNKKKRAKAFKIFCEEVKSPEDYEQLQLAIKNYNDETKDTEPKFIKQGGNFMLEWREWVNHESSQPIEQRKPRL